jgi:hypothetical protein
MLWGTQLKRYEMFSPKANLKVQYNKLLYIQDYNIKMEELPCRGEDIHEHISNLIAGIYWGTPVTPEFMNTLVNNILVDNFKSNPFDDEDPNPKFINCESGSCSVPYTSKEQDYDPFEKSKFSWNPNHRLVISGGTSTFNIIPTSIHPRNEDGSSFGVINHGVYQHLSPEKDFHTGKTLKEMQDDYVNFGAIPFKPSRVAYSDAKPDYILKEYEIGKD